MEVLREAGVPGSNPGRLIDKIDNRMKEKDVKKQPKRLYRSRKDKILGGVCGGLAEYFNLDPVIVRLLWILLVLLAGTGVLVYVIAWIIVPLRKKI